MPGTRRGRWAVPLAAAAPLLLAGCAPRDPPPDAVYRAFVRAGTERDGEAAWALLSRASQARLEERARAAAARAPGVLAPAGPRLLFGDAAAAVRPVKVIELIRTDAESAVLRVVDAGGAAAEVRLVREEGRWRIELPAPAP